MARFFVDLGFVVPEEQNEVAGDSFYAYISEERLDLFDQDLLVFLGLQFHEEGSEVALESIETDPLLTQLGAYQDGRVLFIADEYDDALQFSTVLSIQYLLENLVPEIGAVIPAEDAPAETASIECEAGFPCGCRRNRHRRLLARKPRAYCCPGRNRY